jgi:hypothetical protein
MTLESVSRGNFGRFECGSFEGGSLQGGSFEGRSPEGGSFEGRSLHRDCNLSDSWTNKYSWRLGGVACGSGLGYEVVGAWRATPFGQRQKVISGGFVNRYATGKLSPTFWDPLRPRRMQLRRRKPRMRQLQRKPRMRQLRKKHRRRQLRRGQLGRMTPRRRQLRRTKPRRRQLRSKTP